MKDRRKLRPVLDIYGLLGGITIPKRFFASFKVRTCNLDPHQGAKECERRRRQFRLGEYGSKGGTPNAIS